MLTRNKGAEESGYVIVSVVIAVVAVIIFLMSITNSPTGIVKIPMRFGSVIGEALPEGISFIAPWKGAEEYSIQPHTKLADGSFLSADKVELRAQVQFLFSLNRSYAKQVRIYIGQEDRFVTLIENLCQSALREAAAQMTWIDAAVAKRQEFEHKLHEEVTRLVKDNLITYGFSEKDAAQVVNFSIPVVKAALPPERLATAIADQQAAKEELEKQKTQTSIAKEVANRREQEGAGIANMLGKLPAGFSPEQIAAVINANANYKQAEAMLKAVELNGVDTIVFGPVPATAPIPNPVK